MVPCNKESILYGCPAGHAAEPRGRVEFYRIGGLRGIVNQGGTIHGKRLVSCVFCICICAARSGTCALGCSTDESKNSCSPSSADGGGARRAASRALMGPPEPRLEGAPVDVSYVAHSGGLEERA
eukprot:553329-Prymnesium_polylepis.2